MQLQFSGWLTAAFLILITLSLASCKKDKQQQPLPAVPGVEMEYFNLNNTEIKADATGLSVDINHDGRKDISFSTLLVGDPLYQVDKVQFLVSTNIGVNLPVNENEQIPVLNAGAAVVPEDFGGFHWYELSSVLLVQKIISMHAPVTWEGYWKDALHKYIPFQVAEHGSRYNGWVEISVSVPGEKVIVHRAAISKQPGKVIIAGK